MTVKQRVLDMLAERQTATHADLMAVAGTDSKTLSVLLWKMARQGRIGVSVYRLKRNNFGEVVSRELVNDMSVWGRGYIREYSIKRDIAVPSMRAPSVFHLGGAA